MPVAIAPDGVQIYYESTGVGQPLLLDGAMTIICGITFGKILAIIFR
jgi:hypothetical protein